MTALDPHLHRLQLAVERASGTMRATAWELEAIEEILPDRGNQARKQQLLHTAGRLAAAADLLIAEMAALSPKTVGRVARIGRLALFSAGALIGSVAGGVGEAGGRVLLEQFTHQHQRAVGDIEAVEREAPAAARQLEHELDTSIKVIATGLRIAVEKTVELGGRGPQNLEPLLPQLGTSVAWPDDGPKIPRRAYLNSLLVTAAEMADIADEAETEANGPAIRKIRDAIDGNRDLILQLDSMIRSLEDE